MSDHMYSKAYIMHLEADLSSKLIENEILNNELKSLKKRYDKLQELNRELIGEIKEIKKRVMGVINEY